MNPDDFIRSINFYDSASEITKITDTYIRTCTLGITEALVDEWIFNEIY